MFYWSPEGIAKWPRLVEPDTRRDPDGIWSVSLRVEAEHAQRTVDLLDRLAAEGAAKGRPRRGSLVSSGYGRERDGAVIFTFEAKARGVDRDTGKVWSWAVPVLDTEGAAVAAWKRDFRSGSRIRVRFSAEPFFASPSSYGVRLKLDAVELIEGRFAST